MGYADRVRRGDERILHRAHTHWVGMSTGLALIGACVAMIALLNQLPAGQARRVLLILAAVGMLAGLFQAVLAWTERQTTEVFLTSRRLVVKTGMLSFAVHETSLEDVAEAFCVQSGVGRALGYGEVVIRAADGAEQVIADIAQPAAFAEAVEAALSAVAPSGSQPG